MRSLLLLRCFSCSHTGIEEHLPPCRASSNPFPCCALWSNHHLQIGCDVASYNYTPCAPYCSALGTTLFAPPLRVFLAALMPAWSLLPLLALCRARTRSLERGVVKGRAERRVRVGARLKGARESDVDERSED